MKRLIRMIGTPSSWAFDPPLKDKDFPATPLSDLPAKENKLSFFEIEEEDVNALNDVLIGLASNKDSPLHEIIYIALPITEIKKYRFQVEPEEGKTPYVAANKLHVNIVRLTANDLVRLAKLIYKSKDNFGMKPRQEVTDL